MEQEHDSSLLLLSSHISPYQCPLHPWRNSQVLWRKNINTYRGIFVFSSFLWQKIVSLCCQGFGTDQGFGEILRKMGVGDGEGISFKHFWTLIQSLASTQHGILSNQMGSSCNCILLWRERNGRDACRCPPEGFRHADSATFVTLTFEMIRPLTGLLFLLIPLHLLKLILKFNTTTLSQITCFQSWGGD